MIHLLDKVDTFLLAAVERGFMLVSEWTGLTRRFALRLVTLVYVASACYVVGELSMSLRYVSIFCTLLLGARMAARAEHGETYSDPVMRWLALIGLLSSILIATFHLVYGSRTARDIADVSGSACFFVFWWLVAGSGDGEGRRARMALDKVIEMFGTSWMPAGMAGSR